MTPKKLQTGGLFSEATWFKIFWVNRIKSGMSKEAKYLDWKSSRQCHAANPGVHAEDIINYLTMC